MLDTTHNMAISLKSYQGVFDLDSLVDINFKPVAGFEFERDSLRFDSSDLSYYFKYATAELEDSLTYVVFALAVQYEDAAVIFQNALIEQHPESEGYHNQIFNVTFENYERPVTTKAIHRNFKLDKKMRAVLDGWVRIKGRDLRGRI